MKTFLILFAVIVTAGLAGQEKRVSASDGWVKLPVPGETQAMAFVTIENPGMYEVNVTSATADAGGKVELRDAGKTVDFINVPAYGRTDMAPGGTYLLVRDLKRALKEGDMVTLTLSTDVDVTLKVTATVRKE
jgi:periplasmic copper chaperone A